MHEARPVLRLPLFVFLLWRDFQPGALHPWRPPSGRARFFLRGGRLRADIGPRLQRKGGLAARIEALKAEIARFETTAADHRADFERERERADRLRLSCFRR